MAIVKKVWGMGEIAKDVTSNRHPCLDAPPEGLRLSSFTFHLEAAVEIEATELVPKQVRLFLVPHPHLLNLSLRHQCALSVK